MGRSFTCAVGGGAVFGGVVDAAVLTGQKPTARTSAEVLVEVKGCQIAPGAYRHLITEVSIEETSGLMMSMATVRLSNTRHVITDDDLWEEGAEMHIETGYQSTGLTSRGRFFLTQPKFTFAGGKLDVLLVGFGEEIKLGRTEKRRAFRKVTDAQIARDIADQHGFESDVEETEPVYDQVLQANENDYKFLARRALLHGFMLYVQEGVLHFHRPRIEPSGLQLVHRAGQDSSLTNFMVQSKPFLRGAEFRVTQVDPFKLEVIDESSRDDLDDVTKAMIQSVRNPRQWSDIATADGVRPVRYAVNTGHQQALGPLKEQVQAFSEATRWLIDGSGTTFGLEKMKPNTTIELLGIGKHSGEYYLTKVLHHIRGGAYRVSFEVTRSFTGGAQGNRCQVQTVQPRRAGVVTLAG
jgi:phage protein D